MKRRSTFALTAVGAIAALLISACSSSGSSSASGGSSSSGSSTSTTGFNAGITSAVNPSTKTGGTLTYDTILGKGTTFFVRLPRAGKRP